MNVQPVKGRLWWVSDPDTGREHLVTRVDSKDLLDSQPETGPLPPISSCSCDTPHPCVHLLAVSNYNADQRAA